MLIVRLKRQRPMSAVVRERTPTKTIMIKRFAGSIHFRNAMNHQTEICKYYYKCTKPLDDQGWRQLKDSVEWLAFKTGLDHMMKQWERAVETFENHIDDIKADTKKVLKGDWLESDYDNLNNFTLELEVKEHE